MQDPQKHWGFFVLALQHAKNVSLEDAYMDTLDRPILRMQPI
jgi:hypothetical protein